MSDFDSHNAIKKVLDACKLITIDLNRGENRLMRYYKYCFDDIDLLKDWELHWCFLVQSRHVSHVLVLINVLVVN